MWKHGWQLYYRFVHLFFVILAICILQFLTNRLLLSFDLASIKRSAELPLRFKHDGSFKILQVADMHYGGGILGRCRDVSPSEFWSCSDINTTQFMRRLIDVEKPNLVVFTGDNIFGSSTSDAAESLLGAFSPVIESRVPWAAILGNHDQESTMTREEIMSFVSSMDYSISQVNPSVNDHRSMENVVDVDGFGNYNIKIYGAFGSALVNATVFHLYFLDSGDRSTVEGVHGYGWIKESQLHWMRGVSKVVEAPALAFFHIPIPEVRQLWYKEIVGHFQEAVACPSFNSGVLQTFVSVGDVKAVFMGHDHNNDFCGILEGIWFCYGGGFGYHGYGKIGWHRRARIILAELRNDRQDFQGVNRIRTWKRLDDEKLSMIDAQILWENISNAN